MRSSFGCGSAALRPLRLGGGYWRKSTHDRDAKDAEIAQRVETVTLHRRNFSCRHRNLYGIFYSEYPATLHLDVLAE